MQKFKLAPVTEPKPKHKYARIIRFVQPGTLYPGNICEYDPEKNILRIDSATYEELSEAQRTKVFRASETLTSFK